MCSTKSAHSMLTAALARGRGWQTNETINALFRAVNCEHSNRGVGRYSNDEQRTADQRFLKALSSPQFTPLAGRCRGGPSPPR
jgi:hypothetical protein